MLACKLKHHSEQQTGLNYGISIEVTDLKFDPTRQCH